MTDQTMSEWIENPFAPTETPPRIGTERFNYELQRQEILLGDGWTPRFKIDDDQYGIGITQGYCPPNNASREAQGAVEYDKARRTLVPAKVAAMRQIEDKRRAQASLVVQTHEANLTRENLTLRAERDAWKKFYDDKCAELRDLRVLVRPASDRECGLLAEIERLKKQLWLPVEPGDHNYNGPVKDGEPVPDPVHERFHGSIGDVLAGRVIPAARRQMQEALKNAPKEPTAIPTAGSKDDPRRMGCEWLAKL